MDALECRRMLVDVVGHRGTVIHTACRVRAVVCAYARLLIDAK